MITWIVLTMGDRAAPLGAALDSIRSQRTPGRIVLVLNGASDLEALEDADVQIVRLGRNAGIPGGRDRGVRASDTDIVAFLDDDAILLDPTSNDRIQTAFDDDDELGALSFRIIDEVGCTHRRHVPRVGDRSASRSGPAATFLGGACALRRTAYEAAGGYWADLFYAHEELDLSWRLVDRGHHIRYAADITVRHPATDIARHPDGWYRTGRNRVMVARRNLPWVVAAVHVSFWWLVGVLRSPDAACREAYRRGWRAGWTEAVDRHPIRWATVLRLSRAGRPPVI